MRKFGWPKMARRTTVEDEQNNWDRLLRKTQTGGDDIITQQPYGPQGLNRIVKLS